jgi:hypothetical protein
MGTNAEQQRHNLFPPMIGVSRAVSPAGSPPFWPVSIPRIRTRLRRNPEDCSDCSSAASASFENFGFSDPDKSGTVPARAGRSRNITADSNELTKFLFFSMRGFSGFSSNQRSHQSRHECFAHGDAESSNLR